MPAKLDINYVEFSSSDIGASQAFFKAAFGWSFTDYGPSYQAIDNAGLDGGIAQADGDAVSPLVILYADDLDAAEAAVTAAGGEITKPQFDFPGGRRFHFREPGGNQLAVWSAAKAG
ncbi:VOC family protein [Pelagibacterium halotolerans]|uniref:VOC family protein n=1 Tax=Pelagibacterium halotolerans TaxID=531813 RepID=UPI00384E43E8